MMENFSKLFINNQLGVLNMKYHGQKFKFNSRKLEDMSLEELNVQRIYLSIRLNLVEKQIKKHAK